MNIFLGVDGGQSSTKALVGDETGRVLGAGTAGPCNHVASAAEGREKLARAVRECVHAALQQAGLPLDTVFEAACFGMSGGPDDKGQVLAAMVASRYLSVTHDAAIALAGATGGQPGVIVIAGTGSIAYGRNAAGREMRAGGWGYVFGDEGSAFDIVRQALRAMLRQEEGGGAATALTPLLLGATQSADANQMLHRFYTAEWPRHRIAQLAPMVDHASQEGDAVAIRILENAAEALAGLALSVCSGLFVDDATTALSWVGGVFESGLVLRRFLQCCEGKARCGPPRYEPVAGALFSAYAARGLRVASIQR